MKQFFYTLVLIFSVNAAVFAQSNNASDIKIDGFTARIEQKNLLINWTSSGAGDNNWAVQGSADGKEYATIGYVMGQNPAGNANEFKFKQPVVKMKAGLKYYRVILMETAENGFASNGIRLSK